MAVPKEAIARPSATASAVRSSRILSEDCCMGPPIILRNNPGDDRLFRWRDKRGWPINSRNPRGWYTFVLNERPSLHSPPRVADRCAGVLVRDLCLLFLFELRPVHPVQISQRRPCTVDKDEYGQ